MFGYVVTVSELQRIIHDQHRIEKDAGWIAFDTWVNRRVEALIPRFPNRNIGGLPMAVLFEESTDG